jgi:hypothetical protein
MTRASSKKPDDCLAYFADPPDDRTDARFERAWDNSLWGVERIRGELVKLGIRLAKRTSSSRFSSSGRSCAATGRGAS